MWRVPAFDAVPTFPTLFVLMFMLFMLAMFMLFAGRRMGVCGGIMKPFTGVIGCLPGLANPPSSCCASELAGNKSKELRVSSKHICPIADGPHFDLS